MGRAVESKFRSGGERKGKKMIVRVRNGMVFGRKQSKRRTRWTETETGPGKWCVMPTSGMSEEKQRESGIKASAESLLINDMHYVMCQLV